MFRFLRTFNVFNAEQFDGLPERYYAKGVQRGPAAERRPQLDHFIHSTHADIRHGGGRAFYRMPDDFIRVPDYAAFADAEKYYATVAHELTHNAAPETMPRRCRPRRRLAGFTVVCRHNSLVQAQAGLRCHRPRLMIDERPQRAKKRGSVHRVRGRKAARQPARQVVTIEAQRRPSGCALKRYHYDRMGNRRKMSRAEAASTEGRLSKIEQNTGNPSIRSSTVRSHGGALSCDNIT